VLRPRRPRTTSPSSDLQSNSSLTRRGGGERDAMKGLRKRRVRIVLTTYGEGELVEIFRMHSPPDYRYHIERTSPSIDVSPARTVSLEQPTLDVDYPARFLRVDASSAIRSRKIPRSPPPRGGEGGKLRESPQRSPRGLNLRINASLPPQLLSSSLSFSRSNSRAAPRCNLLFTLSLSLLPTRRSPLSRSIERASRAN